MGLPINVSNCCLYGMNDTPPCMYNSRLGHTSLIFDLPVIANIRLNSTINHVGTPAIDVTFSWMVVRANFSILLSHSSIKAIERSGVRIQLLQNGEFCKTTALKSP